MVPPSPATSLKERYQLADFSRAIDLLDDVNREEVLQGDVDQMWTAWEEKFMSEISVSHEHVSSLRKIPYCMENIFCCSNPEREQSHLCVKL